MQPQSTDLTTITDIDKLQSLAYEQIKILNQTQQNLQAIQQRISQLELTPPSKKE